jgi:hypothetical protein
LAIETAYAASGIFQLGTASNLAIADRDRLHPKQDAQMGHQALIRGSAVFALATKGCQNQPQTPLELFFTKTRSGSLIVCEGITIARTKEREQVSGGREIACGSGDSIADRSLGILALPLRTSIHHSRGPKKQGKTFAGLG